MRNLRCGLLPLVERPVWAVRTITLSASQARMLHDRMSARSPQRTLLRFAVSAAIAEYRSRMPDKPPWIGLNERMFRTVYPKGQSIADLWRQVLQCCHRGRR